MRVQKNPFFEKVNLGCLHVIHTDHFMGLVSTPRLSLLHQHLNIRENLASS
jgi:hypothetical protein